MKINILNLESETLEEYQNIKTFIADYQEFYKFKKYGKDYKIILHSKNWTKKLK